MNSYQRNKRELLKEKCLKYLGGKRCKECGNDHEPICVYDFHHNKGLKEQEISRMIGRKSKLDKELKEELDKCVVLCANCHRKVNTRHDVLLEFNSSKKTKEVIK